MTDFRRVVFFVCDFILFPDENAPRCSANFGSSQNLGGRAAWGRVCERADAADGMANSLRHFLRCEHLRLHAEALLEAVIVDFAIPRRDNQNRLFLALKRERCFAMRPGSQPSACAAKATVALDSSSSRMRSAIPCAANAARTFSIDMNCVISSCHYASSAASISFCSTTGFALPPESPIATPISAFFSVSLPLR